MNVREKMLYNQIHPLKLATDVSTSFASSGLLWQAHWAEALAVAFVPSIVVTALLLQLDLEPYARSPFGRYVARFMTSRATATRIAGQLAMWAGAAAHVPWLLPFGFFVVVLGWSGGLWDGIET